MSHSHARHVVAAVFVSPLAVIYRRNNKTGDQTMARLTPSISVVFLTLILSGCGGGSSSNDQNFSNSLGKDPIPVGASVSQIISDQ